MTRSPASTSKADYCSEADSADRPSASPLEHHCKIVVACHQSRSCSRVASRMDTSTLRLAPSTQPQESLGSVLHPALSTSPMVNVLAIEFDDLASFNSLVPMAYHDDGYVINGQRSPIPASPGTQSPVLTSVRVPSSYPAFSSPNAAVPRSRAGDILEHALGAQDSPYTSSGPPSIPLPTSLGPKQSAPPQRLLSDPSYAIDNVKVETATSWSSPRKYAAGREQLYLEAGSRIQAQLQARQEAQDLLHKQGPGLAKRAPRRLTTKEEANFQCDVTGCGKFFSRSYNFKAHVETHREKREYPFPCRVDDCGKKFVRKTDLQRHHQSVHMKERKHGCECCGRKFARKDTLKRSASTKS